jgi:hypothetical protein
MLANAVRDKVRSHDTRSIGNANVRVGCLVDRRHGPRRTWSDQQDALLHVLSTLYGKDEFLSTITVEISSDHAA